MTPPVEQSRPAVSHRRWLASALAGGAVLGVALLAALYLGRRPIAERLAQGWLAQHRLPGTLEVQSIGLTGLTARLRLGPPDDPDLTVARVRVDYALAGPWNGKSFAVDTRAVHLFRPQLKARIVDGKVELGSLQLLVRALSPRPPRPGPPPDVTVDEGLVRLATPGGALTITGDGALTAGGLSARARLAPFSLTFGGTRIAGAEQTLRITQHDDRILAVAEGGALRLASTGEGWRSAGQTLSADLPAPGPDGRIVGPARLVIQVRDVNGDVLGAAHESGGDVVATLSGTLTADARRQAFDGATGQGLVTVGTIQSRGVIVDHAAARFTIERARWGGDGFGLTVRGAGSGRGQMDRGSAGRLAANMPVLSAEPAYRAAAAKALRAFRFSAGGLTMSITNGDVQLVQTAPVVFESASGARLVMTGVGAAFDDRGVRGAGARATLAGGGLPSEEVRLARWSFGPAGLQADLALAAQLDLPAAQGVRLSGRGSLKAAGAAVRLKLADCAAVSADRLPFGDNPVLDVAGRLCPDGGPLVETRAGGWRARGRIEGARAAAPTLAVELANGAASFSAAGSGQASPVLALTAVKGRLSDVSVQRRFSDLIASGEARLERGVWTGDFAAATPAGLPIGAMRLTHNDSTGAGRADLDASRLAFAAGGLQPTDLTPLASFATDATGRLAFTGWFAWGPDRPLASAGEVVARDLTFKSPAGRVLALTADLRLASLAPLASAKDQQITVHEVQTPIPLTGLAATVDFNDTAAAIHAARAGFAGGRVRLEPMTAPFAPDSIYRGVLILDHVNIGQIVAASNLSHLMTLQALVDGRIPFEVTPAGVRITAGHLAAVGPGRLSIARSVLGGVAMSQVTAKGAPAQPSGGGGLAQEFTYDAMQDLAFDTLDASLDSIANDRLRVLFHIKGRHDPPTLARARIAVGDLLAGKAFSKPVPLPSGTKINLTLDSTLNFGELVRGFEQAWRDSLAASRSATVHDAATQIPSTKEMTRP